jgi:hypothetical protein
MGRCGNLLLVYVHSLDIYFYDAFFCLKYRAISYSDGKLYAGVRSRALQISSILRYYNTLNSETEIRHVPKG